MSKLVVAVCDADEGYRNRFVTYLVEHRAREIAVQAFSKPELFLEAMEKQGFDLVIIGKGFDGAEGAVKEREIPLLWLKDTIPERVAESGGYLPEEKKRNASIFRYQPMGTILHEIQVLTGDCQKETVGLDVALKRMEVIGVYSPIRHEMQMPFAMVMAAMLSEKRKVLYVNLMAHSGILKIFRLDGEYDLGDIILRLRNKRLYPETFLRSVYQTERMYYIPPFVNPENLYDFTLEDYLSFLGFLEDRTDFEVIVFDFGEGIRNFLGMLEHCSSIYCPTRMGFFFECQRDDFLECLQKESGDLVSEQLHMVNLPFSAKRIRRDGDVLKQLLWSEFGDYVREYLAGGGV